MYVFACLFSVVQMLAGQFPGLKPLHTSLMYNRQQWQALDDLYNEGALFNNSKINNSIIIYTGLQQQMYQSPFVKFILYFLEFLV